MRPRAELDIECFANWFLIGISDHATGQRWDFHMMQHWPLDRAGIEALLRHYTIVTFNGQGYDALMLVAALQGWDNAKLKWLNDHIIKGGKRHWDIRRELGLWEPDYLDHIDIMEVAPGVAVGLKVYAGRAHAPTMQDSPVDFEQPIPYENIPNETSYCINDRHVTHLLAKECEERLNLRIALSERYNVDLRSKSDAQIAEAVVKAEWTARNGGVAPPRRWIADGYKFKYEAPSYIQFVSPHLQELLQVAQQVDFVVRDKEQAVPMWELRDDDTWVLDVPKIKTGVQMPKELHRLIKIAGRSYQMGIGGLHSRESCISHQTVPGRHTLFTADVASYYPSLILTLGMYPEGLGPSFLDIYRSIYDERLRAKAAKDKTTDGGLKIVLNGTFGKLWSKYSIFFAPELGIKVTLTGQLALLMLIERLELSGIKVNSANTDGIECQVPEGYQWLFDSIIKWWEQATGLTMETDDYIAMFSRDVNNYIRIDKGGKVKRKGVYRESGVVNNKNPNADICADAVVEFLANHTPIHETIRNCRDVRKFVIVRKVKGGGWWDGTYLGNAVRWVYGIDGKPITYSNGNKVASSDGAYPMMTLTAEVPSYIDYDKYIKIADDMLADIGYYEIPF